MRVAVVGGGMAGLAAAHELAASGAEVVVLEGSDRVGGKLLVGSVGGLTLDLGAESILARRPEGLELISSVGLDGQVVNPQTTTASIWTRGALRTMPPTVMGIPADVVALADSGIAEVEPHVVPVADEDVSVADFVAARLGQDVLDRLVEPLLGGVYAGHSDQLSLRATAPQIAALGADLLGAAKESRAAATVSGPVFAGLIGGVGQLPTIVAATSGIEVQLDATVRSISRTGDGWRVSVGPTTDVETLDFDAVVVAAPAPAAARLLAEVAPDAAFALAAIDYASVAIVTYVFDGQSFDEPSAFEGSGFLVPPIDGTFIKAATVSSNKWGWVADTGHTVIRASVGRAGEATLLQHDDRDIAARALADLRTAFGGLADPIDSAVQRWGGGLPQYDVGHLDRVEIIDRSVATVPGLEVCGAAYRGVGIPAVIASGRAAARRILDLGTMTHMSKIENKGKLAKEINDTIRYTMWSVFKLERVLGDADRQGEAAEVDELIAKLAVDDVIVRGTYDVSGLRADADLMIWWHASTSEALQAAYNAFRRTALGSRMTPVWSQQAIHRPAEFNRSHIPAFMAEEETHPYVCVYPFVRSYEWYLLPDEERRDMLREHGMQAREYPDVRANTVASFALGDYEWILAFEADELHRIVDVMRELRASRARRHVRVEIPFYTGMAHPVSELTALWP